MKVVQFFMEHISSNWWHLRFGEENLKNAVNCQMHYVTRPRKIATWRVNAC
jgi:hypothetical protein